MRLWWDPIALHSHGWGMSLASQAGTPFTIKATSIVYNLIAAPSASDVDTSEDVVQLIMRSPNLTAKGKSDMTRLDAYALAKCKSGAYFKTLNFPSGAIAQCTRIWSAKPPSHPSERHSSVLCLPSARNWFFEKQKRIFPQIALCYDPVEIKIRFNWKIIWMILRNNDFLLS